MNESPSITVGSLAPSDDRLGIPKREQSVLVVLSRLHCQDGIASHLATLLPLLRRDGWQLSVVVGLLDCPPTANHILASIRNASDHFVIDRRLAISSAKRPLLLLEHAVRLKRWCVRFDAKLIHLHGRALGPATYVARLFLGGPERVYTKHLADLLQGGSRRRLPSRAASLVTSGVSERSRSATPWCRTWPRLSRFSRVGSDMFRTASTRNISARRQTRKDDSPAKASA